MWANRFITTSILSLQFCFLLRHAYTRRACARYIWCYNETKLHGLNFIYNFLEKKNQFIINFNIYFLIVVMKDVKTALKSEELKVYILMFVFAIMFILVNTYNAFNSFSEALVSSVFHVSSFMTSTGFAIGDVNIYPAACRIVILILMLVSAFSTFAYADNFDINAFETPGKAGNVKNLVNNTAATVITAARIICVTIAIVILLVIAMKYMISYSFTPSP